VKQRFVLDAWAILAFLQGEQPAAERVKELLDQGSVGEVELFMSIINVGEVIYCVGKTKGENEADAVLEGIQQLPCTIISVTDDAVLMAVRFKMRHTISYADAFAIAAAQEMAAILVTGDPEIKQPEDAIVLEVLECW